MLKLRKSRMRIILRRNTVKEVDSVQFLELIISRTSNLNRLITLTCWKKTIFCTFCKRGFCNFAFYNFDFYVTGFLFCSWINFLEKLYSAKLLSYLRIKTHADSVLKSLKSILLLLLILKIVYLVCNHIDSLPS